MTSFATRMRMQVVSPRRDSQQVCDSDRSSANRSRPLSTGTSFNRAAPSTADQSLKGCLTWSQYSSNRSGVNLGLLSGS